MRRKSIDLIRYTLLNLGYETSKDIMFRNTDSFVCKKVRYCYCFVLLGIVTNNVLLIIL